MSTKGSIIVGDGVGNPQTLAVGTNGYALVADSSSSTGLAWSEISSGGGVVTALNNKSENRLVTIGSTTTELDGEANLTFDGSTLNVDGNIICDTSLTIDTVVVSSSELSLIDGLTPGVVTASKALLYGI